jgi:hypothetical protein
VGDSQVIVEFNKLVTIADDIALNDELIVEIDGAPQTISIIQSQNLGSRTRLYINFANPLMGAGGTDDVDVIVSGTGIQKILDFKNDTPLNVTRTTITLASPPPPDIRIFDYINGGLSEDVGGAYNYNDYWVGYAFWVQYPHSSQYIRDIVVKAHETSDVGCVRGGIFELRSNGQFERLLNRTKCYDVIPGEYLRIPINRWLSRGPKYFFGVYTADGVELNATSFSSVSSTSNDHKLYFTGERIGSYYYYARTMSRLFPRQYDWWGNSYWMPDIGIDD